MQFSILVSQSEYVSSLKIPHSGFTFNFDCFLGKATFSETILNSSAVTSFQVVATYLWTCRISNCFAISEAIKFSWTRAIT